MPNVAIIKDGKIDSIIVVNGNYKPSDNEVLLAEDSIAGIGHDFDGEKFSRPAISKDELKLHAHGHIDVALFATVHSINGHTLVVHHDRRPLLDRLATLAKQDTTLKVPWPDGNTSFLLTAAQVIALNDSVTRQLLDTLTTRDKVIAKIETGEIKTHAAVDAHPGWPQGPDQVAKAKVKS